MYTHLLVSTDSVRTSNNFNVISFSCKWNDNNTYNAYISSQWLHNI